MRKCNFTKKAIVAKELLKNVRLNYLGNLESNTKTSKLFNPNEYEKMILNAVKVKFPHKRMVDVFVDYMESFEELLRKLGLYEEMSTQCYFINTREGNKDLTNGKTAINIRNLIFNSAILEQVKTRHKVTINMAYVYLHAILDEIFMDAIVIVSMLKKEKPNVNSSGPVSHKMDYLIENGVLSKNENDSVWYDDFILFYEIRHAIIHSKGKLFKRGCDKLKGTRHEKTYKKDDIFELPESFLNDWIDNVEYIIDEVASGLAKKFPTAVR